MPWSLILRNLFAHPVRTLLTLLSLMIAMFLVCFLQSIVTALEAGVKASASDRLFVQSAVSLFVNLPKSYQGKIDQVEGVERSMKMQWFGGIYREPSNFFAQFAIDPEQLFEVYDEIELIQGSREAFARKRTACIIGESLARRFDFKVGQRIPIEGTIFPRLDGQPWEFEVAAIFRPRSPNVDEETLFFHYAYIEESQRGGSAGGPEGSGVFVVKAAEGANILNISQRIDAQFENGPQRVQTTTEAEFQRQFVSMLGNVPLFLMSIGGGVVFAILLAVVNTMLMAMRQRTHDFGVLKALGFTDGVAFQLMLYESLLLSATGGLLGCAFARASQGAVGRAFIQLIRNYRVTDETLTVAFGLSLVIGLIAGAAPAWRASRLRCVDALRAEI